MDFALGAPMSLSFTWPERRFQPAKKAKPMAEDASSISRVNPFARDTDHRRLDELLDRWATWIRSGGLEEFEVGAASYWPTGRSTFDDMLHAADTKDAVTMNAAVEDLPPIEQVAVSHVHVGAVWRSNRRESMEDIYVRARANLSDGLRKRRVD